MTDETKNQQKPEAAKSDTSVGQRLKIGMRPWRSATTFMAYISIGALVVLIIAMVQVGNNFILILLIMLAAYVAPMVIVGLLNIVEPIHKLLA